LKASIDSVGQSPMGNAASPFARICRDLVRFTRSDQGCVVTTVNSTTETQDVAMTRIINRVAIIGTGVIGASWAALFLAKGLEVVATDVAPNAEASLRRFIEDAWPALTRLGLAPGASQTNLKFVADLPTAIRDADFVQENGPERIEFKRKLYGELDYLLPADVIVASSSSGLTMSEIQLGAVTHPERCVIGHPFNPPHLIPLVEIVGGAKTSEDTIRRAAEFYTSLGKRTIRLHKELPGHVANRLQAALGREVYYLVAEGVVSVADIDTAVCWGPGLRWGVMGQVLLNHLGGGQGGIEHFFDQFTGPLTAWWKVLGSVELTPETRQKLIAGLHAEVGSRSIDEMNAQRDEILLGLLELRAKFETPSVIPEKVARIG
jgi:3-hydroxyacyl-CoA dehydrogenase